MPKIDTTVGHLVAMIKGGELRLPEMQRRYVWPATRVRDLLDSLYRGYPSGTILVWETDREMPSRDLPIAQDSSPFKGHKLLLDGQQRLTSLSAILRAQPIEVRGRKRPIEILFNLDHPEGPPVDVIEVEDDAQEVEEEAETEADEDEGELNIQERLRLRTFVVASRALLADPRWIRVSDVFKESKSDAQILRTLVKSLDDPLFDKYSKRLQQLRRIRDYPYVMHVLDRDLSYEEVAEIFVRVNSLGMKLRGSDLALAQITSRWQDSLKLFERFQEDCEEKWFTLDLGLIVRALVVFATGQSRFRTVASISLERLKAAWPKAKDGLRFAINFLRTNAGIEDETLLSSPLFIIGIGYYALKQDYCLSVEDERELRRWFYIANARGHYSRGASESTLDADLHIITNRGSTNELLEALRQQLGRFEVEPADLVGRGQRSALFTMAYLALKAGGAKDWRSRLGLSLTHSGRYHFIEHHHVFPKALLKKAGFENEQINEIANMAFVAGGTNRNLSSKPPDEYLARVVEEQGEDALRAHCIPLERKLWTVEGYPRFLEYRRAALSRIINEFIEKDAGRSAALDIDAVIRDGESDRVEFKSSARWDHRERKPNKALEGVIAKTVAGFLNAQGGTLVIGVDDEGKVLGLDADFRTLSKRPDRDGYQQFLVSLLSTAFGKDVAAGLSISFHPANGGERRGMRDSSREGRRPSLPGGRAEHALLPPSRQHDARAEHQGGGAVHQDSLAWAGSVEVRRATRSPRRWPPGESSWAACSNRHLRTGETAGCWIWASSGRVPRERLTTKSGRPLAPYGLTG
jgi:hypothetical protein